VCPKASWAGLICRTQTTTASDCQTPSGQVPGGEEVNPSKG